MGMLLVMFASCGDSQPGRPWPVDLPANPEDGQHYDGVADPYYEGWYHKVALPGQDEAFFFIYSVANPKTDSAYPSEAFVYCGRAKTLHTVYRTYPAEVYRAAYGFKDVRIGPQARATALRIAGQVDDGMHACSWDIDLAAGVSWSETMGWLTGVQGLETNWTVGSLIAKASGWIEFDGEKFRFEDQPGYGDHNWGIIFPREWIWMQANDFSTPDTALAASGGSVDFGQTGIEAYMIGLYLDGEMVTFRSQDFDEISSQADKGHWHLVGERPTERITIEASCDPDTLFHLRAPTLEGMQPRAWESLVGTVEVTLERRAGEGDDWEIVFNDTSGYAGVEIGE